MVIRQRILVALIALFAISPAWALSSIEASVDRNPAIEGEYLVLTVKADDDVKTAKLDTSALLRDFIVGRTSVSRSTQIVNFDSRKETRWQILIAPKTTGQLQIPALTIDGIASQPINLQVAPQGSQPQQAKNLFIRTSLSTEQAYVGQLVTYKVKLFLAVELQRGVLSAPNIEGASIKQLGEDVDTTELVNGRRYRVIERTYAIIADKAGDLDISGADFQGDVLVQSQRRGGMFSFNESRPMQAKSSPATLTVMPIPPQYHGHWLVSDLVALNEDWQQQESYEVGTPITRSFNLLASNADETSLPELAFNLPKGLKSYPEKAQRQTVVRDKQVVAQISQSIAIVPTQPGEYTLPAIEVPWWNAHTRKQELASLPARTITVVAPEGSVEPSPYVAATPAEKSGLSLWFWSTLIFAILWLVTLIAWVRQRNQPRVVAPVADKNAPHTSNEVSLQQACEKGDVGNVLLILQRNLSAARGQQLNLAQIAALSPALGAAISDLQAAVYSSAHSQADFTALLNAVASLDSQTSVVKNSPLSPLNPQ